MNHSLFIRTQILGIALLANIVAAPVWAAPDPDPQPAAARSDLRTNNDDSYRTYRGTVEILLPGNEFNARIDGRIYKIYATDSTRDLRVGDPISIYGQLDRGVNIRYAKITRIDNRDDRRGNGDNRRDRDNDRRGDGDNRRDRDNNRRGDGDNYRGDGDNYRDYGDDRRDYGDDRRGYGDDRRDYGDDRRGYGNSWEDRDVYIGEVTSIKSSREFEVSSDNRTYRIYSSKAVHDLNRGDRVRVSGDRVDNNGIRDARVDVLRGDENYRDNGGISYTGTVASVRSNRDFDVWVDGFVYNIYTKDPVRDLRAGDTVRVNGQRAGSNDIREASARLVRSR